MEANNRRDFLKESRISRSLRPNGSTLLAAEGKDESEFVLSPNKRTDSKLIVMRK